MDEGALRVDGLVAFADHGEEGRPLRMRMHDRLDVGPHPVDAAVQVTLERRIALAFDLVCFEVDRADVVYSEPAALARPDVDQHAVVVEADAAMAVVVDDVGLLEHADAVDELLLQFGRGADSLLQFGCRHGSPPSISLTT